MPDLSFRKSGDSFRFDADTYNVLMEMARRFRRSELGGLGAGQNHFQHTESTVSVLFQNRTGSDLDLYGVVGIGDGIVPYATSATEFLRRPQFRATAPSVGGAFAVLQQPLTNYVSDSTPNTIGRAIIAGCTACKINVGNASHTHAYPTTSTTELTSGWAGPARILAKQSGTGAGKFAQIYIGDNQATYEGYTLTSDYSITAANTFEYLTGFDVASGGTSSTIQFPSTGIWRVTAHVFGRLSVNNTAAMLAAFESGTGGTLLSPKTSYTGCFVLDAPWNGIAYTGYGMGTMTAIYEAIQTGVEGVKLSAAYYTAGTATIAQVRTSHGAAAGWDYTNVTLQKLG